MPFFTVLVSLSEFFFTFGLSFFALFVYELFTKDLGFAFSDFALFVLVKLVGLVADTSIEPVFYKIFFLLIDLCADVRWSVDFDLIKDTFEGLLNPVGWLFLFWWFMFSINSIFIDTKSFIQIEFDIFFFIKNTFFSNKNKFK